MPADPAPAHDAVYSVLTAHRLDGNAVPIAVLLLFRDQLHVRLRDDLADVVDAAAVEVLQTYPEMIAERVRDESAAAVFEALANTLSNYVTMTERHPVILSTHDPESILARLLEEHVQYR